MRELFRIPVVKAARTAASYRLLTREALHKMGLVYVEQTLHQQAFEILFRNESQDRYPQLKAYKEGEPLWWVVVETAMYPNTPAIPREVAAMVLKYAAKEEARVFYAPVMFINTRSQNLSLPSENGEFTALFNRFIPVTKRSLC